jgi:uncharacterized membrane protein
LEIHRWIRFDRKSRLGYRADVTLRTWEFISILLSASVAGMFFGPWVALTRTIGVFAPDIFIAIVRRMNRNMAPVMTALMPAALLSMIPVLLITHDARPRTFYLNLAGFALFVVSLLVTVIVEVPIVKQVETWTASTLPGNWQHLRDRWGAFHVVRVVAGITGFALLLVGAVVGG